jgi:endonuclease YncB( thermonuclease family)
VSVSEACRCRANLLGCDRRHGEPTYARLVRRAVILLACAAVAISLAGCGGTDDAPAGEATVASVADGDTLRLTDGRRVRLVQIDAPELDAGECYARRAAETLAELAPPGTHIRLESDPALDERDRFGRLLRYVFVGSENVNLRLVEEGAASAWFFHRERGRYADEFLSAAVAARVQSLGLWGACPGTRLDPFRQVESG